mmetsp:Transcript_16645/g.41175  ORF Transcript_16645/g.41175 Transcript_16645/m.41175 type:complete len:212 (-) Transcript_16645:28-663(-)
MPWDEVPEIFYPERPFEPAREKPPEGRHQTREERHHQRVEAQHRELDLDKGDFHLLEEERLEIVAALQFRDPRERQPHQVRLRAEEKIHLRQDVHRDHGPDAGEDAAPEEALHRLLRRERDQGRLAEPDADDVGKHVVRDHEGRGEEEPHDPGINVGHVRTRLHHDQQNREHIRGVKNPFSAVFLPGRWCASCRDRLRDKIRDEIQDNAEK